MTQTMQLSDALEIKNAHTLHLLTIGLADATGYHHAVGGIHDPGCTFKALREVLATLSTRLAMVAKGTGTQNAQRIERALAKIPDDTLRLMDTIDPVFYRSMTHKYKESSFRRAALTLTDNPDDVQKALAEQLKGIVLTFLGDMKTPGSGGAKRDARRYIKGIQKLAEWFREALPEHALSDREDTLFYRYVAFWLIECVEWKGTEPKRHIQNALADLERWQKVTL
ncbi:MULTISPECIES: hypothetical protein [unclassified Halomonas]|uniref:hypothetical protein n=1 Tax=unclassified Halomonas TaxID=2609666 RepID=UPI003CF81B2F